MDSHCPDFRNPAPLHVLHVHCCFVLGVQWWYSHDSHESVVKYLFVEVTLASCIMVIVSIVRPRMIRSCPFHDGLRSWKPWKPQKVGALGIRPDETLDCRLRPRRVRPGSLGPFPYSGRLSTPTP